jgi:GDP-L-fucose synthase
MVRGVVYPEARLAFDTTKPDGTPRKLLDVSRLRTLGWRHRVSLRDGIASTYQWFLAHHGELRENGKR